MNNLVIIHIGKCGGGTVYRILHNKYPHKWQHVHCRKPRFDCKKKYVIIIRNPIQRAISAFNWRYHLWVTQNGISKALNRGCGAGKATEKAILLKYKTINDISEKLYFNDGTLDEVVNNEMRAIGHLGTKNIDFYLKDILKKCNRENIFGVITTENLNQDIERIFNITLGDEHCVHDKGNSKGYDTTLSTLAYNNLKKYFQKDYDCISKLYELNLIYTKTYDILSK